MTNLIAPPYLSPSSIFTFLQCPLKYKYGRIDGMKEDPTEATILGNFVHDVLENLYNEVPEKRTIDLAKSFARSLWDSKWQTEAKQWVSDKDLPMMRWKAWWCVENLWKLENPQDVSPSGCETQLDVDISGVRLKGFIDRWSKADNGKITITDYKSGKTPTAKYQEDKYTQLIIYALAIEALEYGEVEVIELLFLKGPDRLRRDINALDRERVTELIVNVRGGIDERCKSGVFETKPSRLCDWCSFKSICPYWNS